MSDLPCCVQRREFVAEVNQQAAELDRLRSELAAKDARIAELEKERDADLWFDQLKMECAKTARLRTLLIDKERDNEALRKQLAEFGAGEDTTTITRKSFAEVLQALADTQAENRLLRARPMHKRPDFRDGIPSDEE